MVDLATPPVGTSMKRKSEDFDGTSSGSSTSTLKPEESRSTGVPREVLIEEPKSEIPKGPTRILIVGPSRSGKTYTIKDSYCGTKEPMMGGLYDPTKRVLVTRLRFAGRALELVDTPGFDNIGMSDLEVFVGIAEYLLNPKQINTGIAGIIYIHRAGTAVYSRSLLRNLRVLTNMFLEKTGVARLHFLVTQTNTQGMDFDKLLDEMRARDSVFSPTFAAGASIAPKPNRAGLFTIIHSCLSQNSIQLPIQLGGLYKSHLAFVAQVEKELGYYEYESAQSLLDDQEQQLRESYEQKLNSQREAELQAREQLQQSQLEYSSLRSQLQLQENTEQSEVVQTLHDLNRMIDDVGRSISAYLTDDYVVEISKKDLEDITTLDAFNLPALKRLVGHTRGTSSLVVSSHGQGMQIEAFFDYAIRHMICCHLVQCIFQPFHPGISPSLDQVLCATYKSIQKQAPQASAGKWRSETFKNVYDPKQPQRTVEQLLNSYLEDLVTARISPLIEAFLGRNTGLKEEHYNQLRSLIQTAWDWNSRLKENVIMLGEFVQITFHEHSSFDAERMVEFEANPRKPQPPRILGTIALGLISQRAVGGGNPIDETVVCKAVVLTKNVFT